MDSTPFKPTIDEEFREFDREHPEVFRLFAQLAGKVMDAGWNRYSADALLHRIRWHFHIEHGDREWKINDHFSSRYARLLMETEPRFQGFFETRRIRTA